MIVRETLVYLTSLKTNRATNLPLGKTDEQLFDEGRTVTGQKRHKEQRISKMEKKTCKRLACRRCSGFGEFEN